MTGIILQSVLTALLMSALSRASSPSCMEFDRLQLEEATTVEKIWKLRIQLMSNKLNLSHIRGSSSKAKNEESFMIVKLEEAIEEGDSRKERLTETLSIVRKEMKEILKKCLVELSFEIRSIQKRHNEISEVAKYPSSEYFWILKAVNENADLLRNIKASYNRYLRISEEHN